MTRPQLVQEMSSMRSIITGAQNDNFLDFRALHILQLLEMQTRSGRHFGTGQPPIAACLVGPLGDAVVGGLRHKAKRALAANDEALDDLHRVARGEVYQSVQRVPAHAWTNLGWLECMALGRNMAFSDTQPLIAKASTTTEIQYLPSQMGCTTDSRASKKHLCGFPTWMIFTRHL